MNIFGLTITREKASLSQVPNSSRGWINLIREPFAGAWQRNIQIDRNLVTSHFAVFACITLIAGDISKLGMPVFKKLTKGVWEEGKSPAYDPVLREPNQFQTPNQFWENWILSKLCYGNAYVLKARDARRVVTRMWVLDPNLVQVLVSDGGDVFYQLQQDNLSTLPNSITVPQSEIIHDRMNAFFHPLVGLSPIYAAGLAAMMGLSIQNNSANFFTNRAIPGGIITAPHTIPDETAERIKREWERRYGPNGDTQGGTAVMGDGLSFESMTMKSTEAQMLEQLKWSAEAVCSTFHVPPYKIGVGTLPSYNNVQALNVEYYSQAVQKQLEDIEGCLLRGLEMKSGTKVEFCIDGLLRMDTASQIVALQTAVGASIMSPNEAREKIDLLPVAGGEAPLSQQQYFSLEALAKRDAMEDPFGMNKPEPQPAPQPDQAEGDINDGGDEQRFWAFQKGLLGAAA